MILHSFVMFLGHLEMDLIDLALNLATKHRPVEKIHNVELDPMTIIFGLNMDHMILNMEQNMDREIAILDQDMDKAILNPTQGLNLETHVLLLNMVQQIPNADLNMVQENIHAFHNTALKNLWASLCSAAVIMVRGKSVFIYYVELVGWKSMLYLFI